MRLGEKQILTAVKKVDFGIYLGSEEERVLLPKKQIPEGVELGDPVEVFLYKDSDDRLIATTEEPKIVMGEVKVLEVLEAGNMGAFLDWGLPKDLLLPFKEQTDKVKTGDKCLVRLYIDKSKRLCASMKVYEYLKADSPYSKGDMVTGIVYDTSDQFGVFVAVDAQYSALIPRREVHRDIPIGSEVSARVTAVKPDGKLDLSLRQQVEVQMDQDAAQIYERIEAYGGELPFNDKADPEVIKREFAMSKASFKRAIGRLLKAGKIEIREKSIAISRK